VFDQLSPRIDFTSNKQYRELVLSAVLTYPTDGRNREMTTDETQTHTTPVFDTLVARTKQLFWGYDGPNIWEEDDETVAFDAFRATTAALEELSNDQWWQIFVERPTIWNSTHDILDTWIRLTHPPRMQIVYLCTLAGETFSIPREDQASFRELLRDDEKFKDEVHERVSDALFADSEIETEDDRRTDLAEATGI
jgi:hypothetical protein